MANAENALVDQPKQIDKCPNMCTNSWLKQTFIIAQGIKSSQLLSAIREQSAESMKKKHIEFHTQMPLIIQILYLCHVYKETRLTTN